MATEYLQAFVLGNAAIIGNVCMLPLYPGLFVMLAGRAAAEGGGAEGGGARGVRGSAAGGTVTRTRSMRWLGVFVLAGVLAAMITIGAAFYLLRSPVSKALPVLLPVMYVLVAVLGVAMIAGKNPFARMATTSAPILRRPSASAFVYGVLMAPLTLPCTGPLIISAFVLGGVAGTGAFANALGYFLAFGLGFGWPLVVLPLLARPFQRQITRFLGVHHRAIGIGSGVLLLIIAAVGVWNDFRPSA